MAKLFVYVWCIGLVDVNAKSLNTSCFCGIAPFLVVSRNERFARRANFYARTNACLKINMKEAMRGLSSDGESRVAVLPQRALFHWRQSIMAPFSRDAINNAQLHCAWLRSGKVKSSCFERNNYVSCYCNPFLSTSKYVANKCFFFTENMSLFFYLILIDLMELYINFQNNYQNWE